jgi:hypothetical protein
MIQNVPGMTALKDLTIVGSGLLWQLLCEAGYETVSALREVSTEDLELAFLRRIQSAIDSLKASEQREADWGRVGRRAYKVLLHIRSADVLDWIDVPAPFCCPITGTWMNDPVIATPSGVTYERAHLERWVDATGTEPCTRAPLTRSEIVGNRALKDAIAMYRPLHERYLIPQL